MKNYSDTLKKIRTDKGYSQKYIAENIITQGNYSKLENNLHEDIKTFTFQQVLNRLEITFEEFLFIHNGFEYTLRDLIIKKFFSQTYNDIPSLKSLKSDCIKFLESDKHDKFITKILSILTAQQIIAETKNLAAARKSVEPIWLELSLRNNLYLTDIFLLNSILYIFPLETAINIKNFAFRQIEKYGDFFNINRLKINFNLNLSLMYILEFKYNNSLELLYETILLCKKEKKLNLLAICYIRKGICLNCLSESTEDWINRGIEILKLLEEDELLKLLLDEISRHSTYSLDK